MKPMQVTTFSLALVLGLAVSPMRAQSHSSHQANAAPEGQGTTNAQQQEHSGHRRDRPAQTQQAPSKPQPPAQQKPHEMEGMQMEGMQMAEPLPPPVEPKLGAPKSAQGRMLRLEEVEQVALKNNPTLSQASAEVRSALGRQVQSGLWPNPTVGYSGEEIRGGSLGGGQQGFFVQQNIILGGKLGLNRKVAAQEVRQAEAEVDEQRFRVLNAVRILYYRALAAQEMVNMRQELARISADTARVSRQLFNIGQRNETEVLEAEVAAEQADLTRITAEHMYRRSMTTLAAVVGDPSIQDATLEGNLEQDLPQLDEQQLLESLLRESPAIRIARAGEARAEAALARARREPIPDLVVRGGLQQNLEQLELTSRRIGLQGFAEVGVQLKLFNRNQGNIRAAQADLERARQEVKRIELVLRERAASFLENYRVAHIVAERYRMEILPRAQHAYERIYHRYGLLQASYPQVLDSQHMLFKLETDYIGALERLWTSSVALKGFLLTEGLEAPSRPAEMDRPVREVNAPSMMSVSREER